MMNFRTVFASSSATPKTGSHAIFNINLAAHINTIVLEDIVVSVIG